MILISQISKGDDPDKIPFPYLTPFISPSPFHGEGDRGGEVSSSEAIQKPIFGAYVNLSIKVGGGR